MENFEFEQILSQIPPEIINKIIKGDPSAFDMLSAHMNKVMTGENETHQDAFLGLSTSQMDDLLYGELDVLVDTQADISSEELDAVPIVRDLKMLLSLIRDNAPIRLTKAGYLPLKILRPLVFSKVEPSTNYIEKIRSEKYYQSILVLRNLADQLKYIKTRKGQITLTKKGAQLMKHGVQLEHLLLLFKTQSELFNWDYNDLCPEYRSIQQLYRFSLYLLKRVYAQNLGNNGSILALKATQLFCMAFPAIEHDIAGNNGSIEQYINCYIHRTFEIIYQMFGIITCNDIPAFLHREYFQITPTPLFNKIFSMKL